MAAAGAAEQRLLDAVAQAAANRTPLEITGGGSKSFYGRSIEAAAALSTLELHGIESYEPTELVLTASAGTPLAEIGAALGDKGQFLPFEPPNFGGGATLGGMVAAGLSGPARPYRGSVRDYVLGLRIINGEARRLTFGGQVMKNVAGYDVSRLMTGALGTLGVITSVSVKVLPLPAMSHSLRFDMALDESLDAVNRWAGRPLPLSAAAWHADVLQVRLSGSPPAVQASARTLGGDPADDAFWDDLKDQRLPFFDDPRPLWRLSLPPAAPQPPGLEGDCLVDWGGAQRWLLSEQDAGTVHRAARAAGGHATWFRGPDRQADVFQPLPPALAAVHGRLKRAFDPHGILNPGRMYPEQATPGGTG